MPHWQTLGGGCRLSPRGEAPFGPEHRTEIAHNSFAAASLTAAAASTIHGLDMTISLPAFAPSIRVLRGRMLVQCMRAHNICCSRLSSGVGNGWPRCPSPSHNTEIGCVQRSWSWQLACGEKAVGACFSRVTPS